MKVLLVASKQGLTPQTLREIGQESFPENRLLLGLVGAFQGAFGAFVGPIEPNSSAPHLDFPDYLPVTSQPPMRLTPFILHVYLPVTMQSEIITAMRARARMRVCFLGGKKFFHLQLELFLLTVKLLCLQSLKALIRGTFPL